MRPVGFAIVIAIVSALLCFALSFPIARYRAETYARSLVEKHPAGSPFGPTVEQIIAERHGSWGAFEKVCAGPPCVTGGVLRMYAGGIAGFCGSEARLILLGNAAGIKGWTYGVATRCFGHHRFRAAKGVTPATQRSL